MHQAYFSAPWICILVWLADLHNFKIILLFFSSTKTTSWFYLYIYLNKLKWRDIKLLSTKSLKWNNYTFTPINRLNYHLIFPLQSVCCGTPSCYHKTDVPANCTNVFKYFTSEQANALTPSPTKCLLQHLIVAVYNYPVIYQHSAHIHSHSLLELVSYRLDALHAATYLITYSYINSLHLN